MELLKRLLFGKKTEIEVPLIGKLSCRINNRHPDAIYGWKSYDSQLLPGTIFLLEGNFEGPFERHINNCLEVIKDIDNIRELVKTKFIENNSSQQFRPIYNDDFGVLSIVCSGKITVDLIITTPNKGCSFVNWREGEVKSIQ